MLKKTIIIFAIILVSFIVYIATYSNPIPATPQENDMLIDKYMKSHDIKYIHQMLETYSKADNAMLKDARRFAYLSREFKNPKSSRPEVAKTLMAAVCAKYKCEQGSRPLMQFFTISSGMWALDSLSTQDVKIREEVANFLNSHENMKKIYEEEGANYSNYWALAAVSYATSDRPSSTVITSALTTYEQLGPLDANALFKKLTTKQTTP